ncbi:FBA_2 domain-containing protein [Caenorhabditis elegans]|uniref:FBA_2 domain-containing protein n=1 Tax=Caenorhabditis elegans TaxID=6239 RepID=D4YW58_CAEEL|nr:FBA_2 domain-containing protein [Caenorhabditis elegans]CCD67354.1 FBA_2 domain-containing protein [Caenorhabditis elegans]|eukprot:NP_001249306.1 Uncharacterized protein CELE_C45E1.5 [Caenorhabditis elegans]
MDTFRDDTIDHFGTKCTRLKELKYVLNGFQSNDGLKDNFYEVELWIYHNCSRYGNIHLQRHNLSFVPVTQKYELSAPLFLSTFEFFNSHYEVETTMPSQYIHV